MNTQGLQAVIWDMDGVIADTGRSHCLSWQQAFLKRGVVFTGQDFQRIFGQRNDTIVRQFMGRDLAQAEVDAVALDKEEYFRRTVTNDLKPFPGVVRLLKLLKENSLPSAIASSAPLENIELILGGLGIRDYFQAVVFGREVSEGKPSPQGYLLAAKKLDVPPSGCVVVEDAVAGVQGAKRAGMRCLAVTNTHPAAGLAEADLVVDSLEKVDLGALRKLFEI